MKKLLTTFIAVLVISAATAATIYATTGGDEPQRGRRGWGRADGPVPVVAAQARTAEVPVWLEGVGTAKARNTVTVRPQVDGKIVSIDFKEGQDVRRGDVLARIDPVIYQAQLDQAAAKKLLDQTQLANARHDLERYLKLSTNVVSAKTVDTQRATVAQLEAQVKSDDAAVENARAVLGYATVTAPIDGRTGLRLVDEGNLVRASDAGIVVIAEVQPISVLFTLPQQQLPQINKARAERVLSVEALETDSKSVLDTGRLEVIDNQVDQATGTIRLKAEFANKDLQLWPGQFVNVRLLVETLQGVVVVPTAAIQRGLDGTFVYVVGPENKVAVRPVTVTQQDDAAAVIASGLAPSDVVVTAGFARLKDGAEVKVSGAGEESPTPPPAVAPPQAEAGETASITPIKQAAHRKRRRDANAAPGATP